MEHHSNDAKFSNLELAHLSDLLYITYYTTDTSQGGSGLLEKVSVPLLKYNKTVRGFELNVDTDGYLNPDGFFRSNQPYVAQSSRLNRQLMTRSFPQRRKVKQKVPGRKYPIVNEEVEYVYSYHNDNGSMYYGDLDGDEHLTGKDAIILHRIVLGTQSIDTLADVNGVDRRVLAYVKTKPLVYSPSLGNPTMDDLDELLKYIAGMQNYEDYAVYSMVPYTPTISIPPTESYLGVEEVIDIGNLWQIKTFSDGTLQFLNNNIGMARIIPTTTGATVSDSDYPNNETMRISQDWKVMYPGTDDITITDDDPAKQLKFLYKNYPQTLIVPYIGFTGAINDFTTNNVKFGPLWQLVAESDSKLKFYFRSDTVSMYYPQVVIGTPESNLSKYMVEAKNLFLN
jgi:hypothetical protein